MKNKYILLLLFVFWGIHASAQTLAQAKALYEKGQYEKAKPAFKKFVKSQPNNGNYNLVWSMLSEYGRSGRSHKVFGNSRKAPGYQRAAFSGTSL